MLHVLESLAPGGIETTFLNALRVFNQLDPSISHHVLALNGGALRPAYRAASSRLSVTSSLARVDRVLDDGHHLVHLLFERCAYRLLPRIFARSAVPVVYGKGYDMAGMYRANEGLDWQADLSLLAAADRVTFTSPQLAAAFPDIPAGSVTLRKAANVAAFTTLSPPDRTTPLRVVAIANVHPRKRLGDLISAWPAVLQHLPHAELRIVGGGDFQERTRLELQAVKAGISARVSFAGHVRDVSRELASARLLALPSSCEGVPTAMLEAMAAARPVVVSRAGHIESVIKNGVEGFVVEIGDVRVLAQRIVGLLVDPERAQRMGLAAQQRARKHDVRLVAADLLATLRDAATNPWRRRARAA